MTPKEEIEITEVIQARKSLQEIKPGTGLTRHRRTEIHTTIKRRPTFTAPNEEV